MSAESYILEADYFGTELGSVKLAQLSYSNFQHECSSQKHNVGDCTGLRLYSGGHVAIRCMLRYKHLITNKRVVELGCGVGALGLLGCSTTTVSKLILTDGATRTEQMVNINKDTIYNEMSFKKDISFVQLKWGDTEKIANILNTYNDSAYFDIVIGCELMYYRTNITDLVNTVLQLTDNCGLFIHSHLFRQDGQEQEIIDIFESHNWCTYEIPLKLIIDSSELQHHPEWYKVRSLVSGPRNRMQELIQQEEYSGWKLFTEDYIDDEDENDANVDSNRNEDEVYIIPNIFK